MVKPFVGLSSNDPSGRCGHAQGLDQPGCPDPATVHLQVRDAARGTVTLLACDAHVEVAEAAAIVLGRHPFGPMCSAGNFFFPTRCEADHAG